MSQPDELDRDEIAARQLFARLDESLRAAAKERWSTAEPNPEHGAGESRPPTGGREDNHETQDPSIPPKVTPDDEDEETRPFSLPDAPDAPQPSAPLA